MTKITIVDEDDKVIGSEERSVVRAKGLRHRIVRVFLVNDRGAVLLQKRSQQLQDTPGKWDQSVGGHVDEGEDYLTAAKRETLEELGVKPENFESIGKFYIERAGPGGYIRRFQTVFIAKWNGPVKYDKDEVAEVRWFSIAKIDVWIQATPGDFTKNFSKAFSMLRQWMHSGNAD